MVSSLHFRSAISTVDWFALLESLAFFGSAFMVDPKLATLQYLYVGACRILQSSPLLHAGALQTICDEDLVLFCFFISNLSNC